MFDTTPCTDVPMPGPAATAVVRVATGARNPFPFVSSCFRDPSEKSPTDGLFAGAARGGTEAPRRPICDDAGPRRCLTPVLHAGEKAPPLCATFPAGNGPWGRPCTLRHGERRPGIESYRTRLSRRFQSKPPNFVAAAWTATRTAKNKGESGSRWRWHRPSHQFPLTAHCPAGATPARRPCS